jgi:hypothetical protein
LVTGNAALRDFNPSYVACGVRSGEDDLDDAAAHVRFALKADK